MGEAGALEQQHYPIRFANSLRAGPPYSEGASAGRRLPFDRCAAGGRLDKVGCVNDVTR